MRRAGALVLSMAALAGSAASASGFRLPDRSADPRPNVILIVTDDQSLDTLPSNPPAMPWLQAHVFDPSDHWLWFPNAVISTPLCCPSRSTILTGRYSENTGVLDNRLGHALDESNTLPVWLHDAGYTTALVGKYLNEYPFHRLPYVPPGWDRWVAKMNLSAGTTYYGYRFIDQGVSYGTSQTPADYATDLLADRAVGFLRTAPTSAPYFLEFTPSAPHSPITPPPKYVGRFAGVDLPRPPSFNEADVSDKPAWVQGLPPITAQKAELLAEHRQAESEALLAVDDAVRRIVEAAAARGDLDRTVIFFLTDNGYSFGAHRWIGKACPYEECIRTPFAVRVPWVGSRTVDDVVSNVDLASTIAGFAGATVGLPQDGVDLRGILEGGPGTPALARPGALIEYLGGGPVPHWVGVRTRDFTYVEDADGTVELYDLTGRLGPADPGELDNRAEDPAYARERARLASLMLSLRGG
ncbi:MAG: sulfatase [Actinobacteria bacterium]|nr:sulfatase [Actinomycetota bacterium]